MGPNIEVGQSFMSISPRNAPVQCVFRSSFHRRRKSAVYLFYIIYRIWAARRKPSWFVRAPKYRRRYGLMLVVPDTSPRGLPGLEEFKDSWGIGDGASFYVNAIQPKWARNFQMYDYVTKEIPAVIHNHFPGLPTREGIFGYSMGGHGALIAALRQPKRYLSVSAFAPICCPSKTPWGRTAFQNYLGAEEAAWLDYDASHLASFSKITFPILVDQGMEDPYLEEQLRPVRCKLRAKRRVFHLTCVCSRVMTTVIISLHHLSGITLSITRNS